MVRSRRRRWGRLLGAIGVFALLGGGFALYRAVMVAEEARRQEQENLAPPPAMAGFPLKGGLRATAEQLDDPYRLAIDARLVEAARLAAPSEEGTEPAAWELRFPAGSDFDAEIPFPDPPTFVQALGRISGHVAAHQMHKTTALDPSTWLVSPEQALREIDKQTRASSTPGDQLLAARAAISLAYHSPGRLLSPSYLPGLALAWLASAEQQLRAELVGERAVLARVLGYAEESRNAARQLPSGAFPDYLRFDDDSLRANQTTPEGRTIWWRRQLELGSSEEGWTYLAIPAPARLDLSGTAALLTARSGDALARGAQMCWTLVQLGVAELAGAKKEVVFDLRERLAQATTSEARAELLGLATQQLEGELAAGLGLDLSALGHGAKIEKLQQAAVLKRGSETARRITHDYVDDLASACLAMESETGRGSSERTPSDGSGALGAVTSDTFKQLERWRSLRERARNEREKTGALIAEAEDLGALGPRPHYLLFRDLRARLDSPYQESAALAQYLARHLDTRPVALRWAAEELPIVLRDRRYREYFCRSWVKLAASLDPDFARWWSDFSTRTARDVLNPTLGPEEFRLRALLQPGEDDFAARRELTDFLFERNRAEEVPPVVDPWLRSHPTATGPGLEWALSALARVELSRREPGRARTLMRPIEKGMSLRVLAPLARIALLEGDVVLAKEHVDQALRLFPNDLEALLLGLEFTWSAELSLDVVHIVRTIARLGRRSAWEEVQDEFVSVFREREPEVAKQAYAWTFRSIFDPIRIGRVAQEFRERQLYAHCASLLELTESLAEGRIGYSVLSYACRRESESPEKALRWLAGQVRAGELAALPSAAFEFERPELLWDFKSIGDSLRGDDLDRLWALRAAMAVKLHGEVDPRVSRYFRDRDGATGYVGVGRYLTGLLGEAEFIAAASDDRTTSLATYYLGLTAESKGKIAEAIIWYRACVQANRLGTLEHRMASQRLEEIHRTSLPLRSLSLGDGL